MIVLVSRGDSFGRGTSSGGFRRRLLLCPHLSHPPVQQHGIVRDMNPSGKKNKGAMYFFFSSLVKLEFVPVKRKRPELCNLYLYFKIENMSEEK